MPKREKLRTEIMNLDGFKNGEIPRICRACLGNNAVELSLFAPYQYSTASALINIIADVKITQGDGLPDMICQQCLLELETSVNFKKKCEESNVRLLQLLNWKSQFPADHQTIKTEVFDEVYDTDHALLEDFAMSMEPTGESTSKQKKQDNFKVNHDIRFTELPGTKVQCDDCGEILKSKCKMRVHWKNTHNTHVCSNCKRLFKSIKAFNRHQNYSKVCINPKEVLVEGVGKNRMFKCAKCHYETRVLAAIRLHAYIHNGKRPYKCNSCPMAFNQISCLNVHKEQKHCVNVKQITCQYCGKEISGRNKIYRHMKSHSNNKYQCDICKKSVMSKSSLIGHLKRHSGVKSYTCELCASSYYTMAELCNHKRAQHSTKAIWYNCNICEYKCKRKHNVLKHQARHTSTNVACQKCGLFFHNFLKLQSHSSLHASEKKFACPICLHKFHRRDSVRNHIRKKHKVQTTDPKKTIVVQLKEEVQDSMEGKSVNLSPDSRQSILSY